MLLIFNDIGGWEVIIIFLLVLMFFGADSIPGIARTMGKTMNQFRDAANEIKKDIKQGTDQIKDDLDVDKHLDQ